MIQLALLDDFGNESYLEPTVEQIDIAISQLDNTMHTGLILYMLPIGLIQVFGGRQGKVTLSFRDGNAGAHSRRGELVDPNLRNSNDEVEMSIGGEMTLTPSWLTVSKEVARDVLVFFFEHQTLPKGLTWEGNMSNYQ